jgi:hypothetical protein
MMGISCIVLQNNRYEQNSNILLFQPFEMLSHWVCPVTSVTYLSPYLPLTYLFTSKARHDNHTHGI